MIEGAGDFTKWASALGYKPGGGGGGGVSAADIQNLTYQSAFDSGEPNAYVLNLTPAFNPNQFGLIEGYMLSTNSVTDPTLSVNGFSATIYKGNGLLPLDIGDIQVGNYSLFMWANGNYVLLNPNSIGNASVSPAQIQEAAFVSGTDSGAADAYVVTLSPSASFTEGNGTVVSFSPLNANLTTSPTLAVNGNSALPILLPNNTAVAPGDMATGSVAAYVVYSNGVWLLLN